MLGVILGLILIAAAYFYVGYYRPLTTARNAMSRFAAEVRAHRAPVSVACPAAFDTALLTRAMRDPAIQSCHPIGYSLHEPKPVFGTSLNPRLELRCATGTDVHVAEVVIALFGIQGKRCGPQNLGFVPASIAVMKTDGTERVLFRLPYAAHEKLFGH